MTSEIPGYWMYEVTGVLQPVVMKYLRNERLSDSDVAVMRAYLRQWINADGFRGAVELRFAVDQIRTHEDVARWIHEAEELGIDPL